MRFPLRLTAELAKIHVARAIGRFPSYPLILNAGADSKFYSGLGFDPGIGASPDNIKKKSETLARRHASSPIVWIGGAEPLANSEVARMASGLSEAGRYVFLQTDGQLLRRRIHEFRPSSRLYLTIRFDGTEHSHDQRNGCEGAYRAAIEGIRAARLSGFLICAHSVLHSETGMAELEHLRAEFDGIGVDGMVITRAELTRELEERIVEARQRFLGWRWALLSGMFDEVALSPRSARIEGARAAPFEEGAEA